MAPGLGGGSEKAWPRFGYSNMKTPCLARQRDFRGVKEEFRSPCSRRNNLFFLEQSDIGHQGITMGWDNEVVSSDHDREEGSIPNG